MYEIYNVKCNWQNRHNTNQFEGKIILSSDGYFEGVVKDSYFGNDIDILISGIFVNEKRIVLLKYPIKETSYPLLTFFITKKENNNDFNGNIFCFDDFNTTAGNISSFVLQKEDVTSEKINILESEISNAINSLSPVEQIIVECRKVIAEILEQDI